VKRTLSQEELAERAGLSVGAVAALETGRRTAPRPATVRMLADALGLDGERRSALLAAALPDGAPAAAGSAVVIAAVPTGGELSPRPPPLPPTRIIGRQREAAALRARLLNADAGAGRLVTLTGPGGVGKTRLALAVAGDLVGEVADGVAWVDLAPVRDPAFVAAAIAAALGVREEGGRDLGPTLVAAVRDRQILLVLDNVEQVIAAAPLVADLLARCPTLRVLATSRERLRLHGEKEISLEPLVALLDDPEHPAAPGAAVQLFVERAAEVAPGFAPAAAALPVVAEICRRLDGIPLAIELAAMRVRHLPPAAILARLERRLPLLTGGSRDLPERQQTMRAAIAWSYDLLAPDDRRLFRRLAVCAGGFDAATAAAVAGIYVGDGDGDGDGNGGGNDGGNGGGDAEGNEGGDRAAAAFDRKAAIADAFDGLCRLADQSLLRQATPADGTGDRFGMLETVREFAGERLLDADDGEAARRRHANYFARFAEAAEPELTGPRQGGWFDRLETEHDNLRAALAWAVAHDPVTALRLGAALWRFWWQRGHAGDGRRWLEQALAADDAHPPTSAASPALRLRALYGAGSLADVQGDFPREEAWHAEGLALARRVGDRLGELRALNGLGLAASGQGDDGRAAPFFADVLAIARELSEPLWIANGALNLGEVTARLGDLPRGQALLAEALALYRERGHAVGTVYALTHLGAVTLALGERAPAVAALREALADGQTIGVKPALAEILVHLGHAAAAADPVAATQTLAAAAALHEAIGAVFDPLLPEEHARVLAALRGALGETAFADAWAAGRLLSPEAAAAAALAAIAAADATLPNEQAPAAALDARPSPT
jgi:predicted ATPase/transcriptional regulator with XRE-family HTH domain